MVKVANALDHWTTCNVLCTVIVLPNVKDTNTQLLINKNTRRAQTCAKHGSKWFRQWSRSLPNLVTCSLSRLGHLLKISSKSIHNFLSYLSLKISFHGSGRSRLWSGSLPKLKHFFVLLFSDRSWNFFSKSVHKFWSYLIHKRTNTCKNKTQTNTGENITSLAEVIRNFHNCISYVSVCWHQAHRIQDSCSPWLLGAHNDCTWFSCK